ncbi:Uncharacterised protein [Vibrio cholerae]|nr:Uncharacterised protein [Vibrio cholerae]
MPMGLDARRSRRSLSRLGKRESRNRCHHLAWQMMERSGVDRIWRTGICRPHPLL